MAITPDRAGFDEWRKAHPAWDEYDVIDATETRTRHSLFRTPLGLHYEGTEPQSGEDREVNYRVQVDTEVVVLGEFPEVGQVWDRVSSDDPGKTTIRASMPGKWFKTGSKTPV